MLNHIFNALQTFITSHIFLLQCNTRLSICIRLPVICLILHSLSLSLSVQRENTNRMNNAKLTLACKVDPTFCLTRQSKSKSNTNICRLKLHTLVIYICSIVHIANTCINLQGTQCGFGLPCEIILTRQI